MPEIGRARLNAMIERSDMQMQLQHTDNGPKDSFARHKGIGRERN